MLGLRKGAATVLPHDPQWEAAARTAIETLKSILGDAAVDKLLAEAHAWRKAVTA